MPADFELDIYDTDGNTLLGSTSNVGTDEEQVILNGLNPNNDYYARVYGAGANYHNGLGYCLHITKSMTSIYSEEEEVLETEILSNPIRTHRLWLPSH